MSSFLAVGLSSDGSLWLRRLSVSSPHIPGWLVPYWQKFPGFVRIILARFRNDKHIGTPFLFFHAPLRGQRLPLPSAEVHTPVDLVTESPVLRHRLFVPPQQFRINGPHEVCE